LEQEHFFRGLSEEFLANALNSFDTQVVVVYGQNLLCPHALAVRAARGNSLELEAAAATPKRGLMRPLLAFLKDRLGWWKTFENCQNICRKRVRIYFKIEAEIRAKETVSIYFLKYVRIHTSETSSQR
jgi:hypothetical protein